MFGGDDTHADSEDGENYFVSMTDMMVGILFIFIIMLMTFALDFRRTTDVQEDAIVAAQQVAKKLEALETDVRKQLATLEKSAEIRRQLLSDIRAQLILEGLHVEVDEINGLLRLTEDAVRFAPNQTDLLGKSKENVSKIARVLGRVLPSYAACQGSSGWPACTADAAPTVETVFIEGHTDTTGVSDRNERDRRNWELSTSRAVNTYRELSAVSPALRSLRNRRGEELISVSGYSSTRPIDARESPETWEKNRRIDLRFVMEVDNQRGLNEILKLTGAMREEIIHLGRTVGAKP